MKNLEFRPAVNFIKEWAGNNPLVGAEVGVCEGKNALAMLVAMPNLAKLYLVDPYRAYRQDPDEWMPQQRLTDAKAIATDSLSSFKKRIEWKFQKFQRGIIDQPLDFIYIDADHHYSAVLQDIKIASEIVRPNGVIAGHDIQYSSVKRALDEYCRERSISKTEKSRDWWFFNKKESLRS